MYKSCKVKTADHPTSDGNWKLKKKRKGITAAISINIPVFLIFCLSSFSIL
jgi:hypothetical protein